MSTRLLVGAATMEPEPEPSPAFDMFETPGSTPQPEPSPELAMPAKAQLPVTAAAQRSTNQVWAAHFNQFKSGVGLLREKSAEQEERLARLQARQAALAEKHGGAKVKGTDKVKLNVGGTRVVARRETLTQFPTTRLASLFSGRWENRLLRDKKKRIFLDVNPTCFKKIVDFLNLYKIADPDDPPGMAFAAPAGDAGAGGEPDALGVRSPPLRLFSIADHVVRAGGASLLRCGARRWWPWWLVQRKCLMWQKGTRMPKNREEARKRAFPVVRKNVGS